MYKCEICKFETSHKSNHTAHIKTKRHIAKVEITTETPPITHQNHTENTYTCNYCNHEYSRLDSLKRHQKKCVKQRMEDNCKQLEDKDKQIELLTNDTNKKLEQKDSEIKELKQKNEELTKSINKIKDTQLSVLQKNLKPANNNNSQVIINNYPNAPNLSFPENIPVDQSLKQYIQLGSVKGLGKFISDHWAKDINPVDRSIWMVDPARNKFLIRINNAWVIDIDGKQFEELNLEKIQSIFHEYLEKYKFDNYDLLKNMEFINDINTKNMIIKGLKDAGKYLVYDKEKFTDFDKIENDIIPEIVTETIVD